MAAKESIALIGVTNGISEVLAFNLAQSNYRLLLIANDKNQSTQRLKQIIHQAPHAEVEIIDCVKEGCWEADIIILAGAANVDKEIIGKMKEVATQKIVVYISENRDDTPFSSIDTKDIQQLIPHSKVVRVFNISGSTAAYITEADETAVATISNILEKSGYKSTIVENSSENRNT